ncbi:alcohol-forming fatty acyl-CoA reductase-like isoform X1 [Amaranthus tricolor]|uniref:alcohol-forming fatty acyl-CoA reductase-like isoform X1 n=1 Tax=Amaranthus tricolor TaxID=29722 RepID=UPI0025836D25|nr:alcohol-forming fatty acyl-CoA reductase-like isoform X1 [Amaranthus tricolor]
MSSVLNFLENKSILITGGAGFLAKIFAEKVLRTQPNVKKLYLLIRAADNKSALLRLQNEVIGKALFKVLKQKMGSNFNSFISEKISVVAGDITCEDLGIKECNIKEQLWREIDVIVNLAATTNFDERYDLSLYLNTFGAKHVLDFAKKCTNFQVLVQVSTAYVSGERGGLIQESPYYKGDTLNGRPGLDFEFEKKLIKEKLQDLEAEGANEEAIKYVMRDMGLERAKHWGWPNVYVFTKALGEMFLMHEKGDIPLVILRPTIVTSTFKEPFAGWVEGIRTIDSLAVAYGKGRLPCFVGDPDSVVDVIPGDMVSNAILVAAMIHANEKGNPRIYQVGSSVKNPTTFSTLHEVAYQYFQRHPWINKEGKPIQVGHVRVLGSMDSFKRYLTLHYLLPLKALELANIAFCQSFKGTFMEQTRKINFVMRLIDIYRPYLFFKGIYDDSNTEKLRIAARNRGVETDIFYFDPKAIDWEDYFMNIHLPGLVKYVFK